MQNNELLSSNAEIINVDTGEVKVTSRPAILRALALGSCVAMIAYDGNRKIGGLAHIMLPGRSLKEDVQGKMKYAEDAIDTLISRMKEEDIETRDLDVSLIGGANVLAEGDIPDKVIRSILDYLERLDIKVKAKRIGGAERRSASLDIRSGKILYTEGDSVVREL